MIKLTKRIENAISREFSQEVTKIKCVFFKSISKESNIHLIVLKVGVTNRLVIMRYFGDGTYDFLTGFNNWNEVVLEIENQVKFLL